MWLCKMNLQLKRVILEHNSVALAITLIQGSCDGIQNRALSRAVWTGKYKMNVLLVIDVYAEVV